MTVCIATICEADDERKIVLCTDRRSGSVLGSAETALKDRTLPYGWRCLTSGTEADILALVRLYRQAFNGVGELTHENLDATIKAPLFERKKELAEEYVRHRFAISHDEFISHGRERLPSDIFHEALQRIGSFDLKVDLILAGFIGGYSDEIYHCSSRGIATPVNEYAVIGEGRYLAEAALLRRGQNDIKSLDETVYNVYEAKKHAEAVGSVGAQTVISVLSSDGSHKMIGVQWEHQLHTTFQKLYPKIDPKSLTFTGTRYWIDEEVERESSSKKSGNEDK